MNLLDWLRNKVKITPEEQAKRDARQAAIARYNVASKKHAQYAVALIRVPAPKLQDFLDDPNYVWDPVVPSQPDKPRPI